MIGFVPYGVSVIGRIVDSLTFEITQDWIRDMFDINSEVFSGLWDTAIIGCKNILMGMREYEADTPKTVYTLKLPAPVKLIHSTLFVTVGESICFELEGEVSSDYEIQHFATKMGVN